MPEQDRVDRAIAVAVEDVLAAQVVRKALRMLAGVFAFVGAVLTYACYDIGEQRERIAEDRAQLQFDRDSLASDVRAMRAEVASVRDELMSELAKANGLVSGAESLVDGAQEYQRALADHLSAFGRTQANVEQAERNVAAATARLAAAESGVQSLREQQLARVRADSLRIANLAEGLSQQVSTTLDMASKASDHVLNRWGQVVDEERRTPVADSRFWMRFDDIRENELTKLQVWHDDGRALRPVANVPDVVAVGDSVTIDVGGQRYRLIVQAKFRDPARFGAHNDRVVVRLERVQTNPMPTRAGGA